MLRVTHFRQLIVRPAIRHLGLWSAAAENLLIGTALVESGLKHLRQLGGGPALGLYQIEPATHADVWDHFLDYRDDLADRVEALLAEEPAEEAQLVTNLAYATAIARLIYWRVPEPLPAAEEIEALGVYWKTHFNTALGKGDPAEFAQRYRDNHD